MPESTNSDMALAMVVIIVERRSKSQLRKRIMRLIGRLRSLRRHTGLVMRKA